MPQRYTFLLVHISVQALSRSSGDMNDQCDRIYPQRKERGALQAWCERRRSQDLTADKSMKKLGTPLRQHLAELYFDLGHRWDHLDLRKIVEYREQRLVRVDEAMPPHLSGFVRATLCQRRSTCKNARLT